MTGAAESERPNEAKDDLKTITLTRRDVQAAARLLRLLAGSDENHGREITAVPRANVHRIGYRDRLARVEVARQIYENRARRSLVFKSAMFGEAAWDMLLALYITDEARARYTVNALVSRSGVAPTTAMRWLDFLEKEQLVSRKSKPTDKRVSLIELTDKARELLDKYLSGTAPGGA